MTRVWIVPPAVPAATVRRLPAQEDQAPVPVQVRVPLVASPMIVPRQTDPVGLRLMALQSENDELRAELEQLRTP